MAENQDNRPGIIVPANFPPGPMWDKIMVAAERLGDRLMVIANPELGPGQERREDYAFAFEGVRRTGAKILGYVVTHPLDGDPREYEEVLAEIRAWYEFYRPDGIFFDEFGHDPNRCSYFQTLWEAVQEQHEEAVVVNNFARSPDRVFFEVESAILCIFEKPWPAFRVWTIPTLSEGERDRSLIILYDTPAEHWKASFDRMAQQSIAWLYLTNHKMPNPFGQLPDYFDEMIDRVVG